jgi:site-specific DNA recombinase
VLRRGTPGQRKAIIETHIAEIKIRDGLIGPVFKLPRPDTPDPSAGTTGTTQQTTVRAMVRPVGRVGLEPTTDGL